jgi:hypothetical protein
MTKKKHAFKCAVPGCKNTSDWWLYILFATSDGKHTVDRMFCQEHGEMVQANGYNKTTCLPSEHTLN